MRLLAAVLLLAAPLRAQKPALDVCPAVEPARYVSKAFPTLAKPDLEAFKKSDPKVRETTCGEAAAAFARYQTVSPEIKKRAENIGFVYLSWRQAKVDGDAMGLRQTVGLLTGRYRHNDLGEGRLMFKAGGWTGDSQRAIEAHLPDTEKGYFEDFFEAVEALAPLPDLDAADKEPALERDREISFNPNASPGSASGETRILFTPQDLQESRLRDLRKLADHYKFFAAEPAHQGAEAALGPTHCVAEMLAQVLAFRDQVQADKEAASAAEKEAEAEAAAQGGESSKAAGERLAKVKDPFGGNAPESLFAGWDATGAALQHAEPDGARNLFRDPKADPRTEEQIRSARFAEALNLRVTDLKPQIQSKGAMAPPPPLKDYPDYPQKSVQYDTADLKLPGQWDAIERDFKHGDIIIFHERSGGAFGDLGHTGIGWVEVDKDGNKVIYRADSAYGNIDDPKANPARIIKDTGERRGTLRESVGNPDTLIIRLPAYRMESQNGRISGDVAAEYMKAKRSRWHCMNYCSNSASDVLVEAGYNVGWGTTPGFLVDDITMHDRGGYLGLMFDVAGIEH